MVHQVVPSSLLVKHGIFALPPATKDRHHTCPFPAPGDVPGILRTFVHRRESCGLHQCGHDVHKFDHFVSDLRSNSRHSKHEGGTMCNLKIGLFVPLCMLSKLEAMVADKHDHRVLARPSSSTSRSTLPICWSPM